MVGKLERGFDVGQLKLGEVLELVDGELISKMGKNRVHVNALVFLQAWLVQVFGFRFVNPEAPINVATEDNLSSEPEPDLIVTRSDTANLFMSIRSVFPEPEDQ